MPEPIHEPIVQTLLDAMVPFLEEMKTVTDALRTNYVNNDGIMTRQFQAVCESIDLVRHVGDNVFSHIEAIPVNMDPRTGIMLDD